MILAGQWEPTPPRTGSLDDCTARGFDTDSAKWDRVTPEPLDETWQAALDGAIAEARRLRARRCAHPHCRTSLDEYPVECGHGLAFCQHCAWEEGCDECGGAA